jgi:hypothetical protein
VFLGANVDPREFAALQRLAQRMNMTMTELLRAWLRNLETYSETPLEPSKPPLRPRRSKSGTQSGED